MKKKQEILVELIDKMFELAGHTVRYENIADRQDNWFQQYTMTEDQNKEWQKWGIKYLQKKKRWTKEMAERERIMIDLYCGLKIEK